MLASMPGQVAPSPNPASRPGTVAVTQPSFQVVKVELVQAEVVDGGTSAVLLSGAAPLLPAGAVRVAPIDSSTGRTTRPIVDTQGRRYE